MTETPGAQTQAAKAAARKRAPSRAKPKPVEPTEGELKPRPKSKPTDAEQEFPEAFKFSSKAIWEIPEVELPFSVHESWCRVMESVRSVEKGDYNKDQHFRFRGIDAVMEAVGPALRNHHVHVRPRRILEHSATEYTSKGGSRMVNRIVRVEWEVTGPQGDSFVGESMGEAADTSDKSLTKAQSVAYRVFLLNALTIPTGDPDPDAETPERATPSEREQAMQQASARSYASREEFERERAAAARQSPSQDEQRQAQAGEENQAAQPDNEEARKELWRVAKGLGWQWNALASRFASDHDGRETKQASKAEIEAFITVIVREAEEEEERAKQIVAEQLGGQEVDPAGGHF